MDWEANLAAIIKCTDANLEQQFRQFADMTGDLTTYSSYDYGRSSAAAGGGFGGGLPFQQQQQQQDAAFDDSSNIGTAYFRESMASNLRYSGEYSGGGGFTSSRSVGMPTSFSDEFRKRQERKRSEEPPNLRSARASGERYDNNNNDDQGSNADFDEEFGPSTTNNNSNARHQYPRRAPRSRGNAHGMPYQMYNSPTYDIAQMMEQVRLSLKLEVDARAAIAERQLSALLNLCKASTEEMDRLRVEVCANDRQIHTLEQVQSKLRQELTTQKDIGFHLQSMCGKDESWRMQAENQLLELRQLVAAVREQGNSLHATSQEKLSRAELLVQFNASIEPIKAQFQANLQHQAQQIAEVTRTTSSSSLLLDALTLRVNRGLTDEIADLRNEVYALKSHVSKMSTMLDGNHSKQQPEQVLVPTVARPAPSPVKDPAEEIEREQQKAKRRPDLVEETRTQVILMLQDRFDTKIKDLESNLELKVSELAAKQDEKLDQQQTIMHSACEERSKSLVVLVESQVKSLKQQVQSDLNSTARDFSERLEQLKQQMVASATLLIDAKTAACQNRQLDLLKMVECEQKERKSALDALQESCRKSRHSLEDQVHAVAHEARTKAAQVVENVDSKVRDCEKSSTNMIQALEKDLQTRIETLTATLRAQSDSVSEKMDAKLRNVEDSVAKLGHTMASLSVAAAKESVVTQAKESERAASSVTTDTYSSSSSRATIERETSAYLATMEAMLQKMQLQLQLQTQAQVQAQAQLQVQAAQVAQMHAPPYWVSSPHYAQNHSSQPVGYASHQQAAVPAAPLLAQPPTTYSSGSSGVQPPAAPAVVPEPQQEGSKSVSLAPEAKSPSTNSIDNKKPAEDRPPNVVTLSSPVITSEPAKPAATESQAAKTNSDPVVNPAPPAAPMMVDPVEKIHLTIAATAKGALAEAEMAKLRVENRRKQENELRQQQQQQSGQLGHAQAQSQPLSDPSVASQPAASSTAIGASQKVLEQRHAAASSHPQLVRAASMSALLPAGSSLPVGTSSSRSSEAAAAREDGGGDRHVNSSTLRQRSNSICGSATQAASLSQQSPPSILPLSAHAQQKVATAQPVNTVQLSANALTGAGVMTTIGGKPPPPPSLPPQSSLVPRAAVSSTSEAKTGPPPSALNSPRSFPPPPAVVSSSGAAPNPAFVSSNPPTTGIRAATEANSKPPAPSPPTISVPPATTSLSQADSRPSTPGTKLPSPSAPLGSVPRPATAPSAPSQPQSLPPQSPSSPHIQSSSVSASSSSPAASHVLCAMCRLPIRTDQREEHERSQCPKRTQECNLCRVKVLWSEVDTHERSGCSSFAPKKAVSTSDGQNITVDDSETLTSAATAALTTGSSGSMKKCRHCSADVASQDLFDHELRCDKILKQCPHCLRRQKMSELQDHIENCDCRLVPCPNNCGGKFLQRGIPKHLATRCPNKSPATTVGSIVSSSSGSGGINGASTTISTPSPVVAPTAPVTSAPPSLLTQSPASTAPKPAAAVPSAPSSSPAAATVSAPAKAPAPAPSVAPAECKFCDEEFLVSEIDEHEDKCDWKPKRCQHCNMVIISRDLARHESSCKTSVKSCPHCSESMPHSALAAHSARCSKRPIKCIRCCQQFPADSIVAHSTNCKFVPTSASNPSAATGGATQPPGGAAPAPRAMSPAIGAAAVADKIPPPPPYPPTAQHPSTTAPSRPVAPVTAPSDSTAEESLSERMARRNLALSQLTKPTGAPSSSTSSAAASVSLVSTAPASANAMRSNAPRGSSGNGPEQNDDHDIDDEEDEEEEEEEDDEDEEDQLTLTQVVAEWNVENVCLWLHEDVGVPEVVPRFQQRRCTGEMLLDLSESDLINDFDVKNRIHRERILSAIDAIKTSDDFSDEDEDEEDDDDEEDEAQGGEEEDEDDDSDEGEGTNTSAAQRASRASMSEVPFMHPRDLLRRNTLPSPQRGGAAAAPLPSSSAMLRRINTALSVDFPNSPAK